MKLRDVRAFNTPSVRAVLEFLCRAPRDEVYTLRELANRVGFSEHTLDSYGEQMEGHRYRVGSAYFYGHRTAIVRLRGKLENQ